ncbi:Signal peptidase I [Leucobacter sp. 7(1)]|uniref:signal peptidase I n=1 Tax=Leucobacter sp. 7(1) TaxID=1255613 RepID=UPI00097F67E2|nr:signal peptidase I [Leucobacter sp. 7(1)]SJN12322.1 Signal peptidase I [Leucobacter sp. 7(1)]
MARRGFAILGTTAIVAAVVALAAWGVLTITAGATLVVFRTGSMAPAIPQGALAVSFPVAAEEIQVGDVVTVQRPGEDLPVSHRVIEVRAGSDATVSPPIPRNARELVMQGDANAQPDMRPAVVRDARRVVWSAPGAGTALMMLQSPIGLGGMVVGAGALTTWAFWPRRSGAEA